MSGKAIIAFAVLAAVTASSAAANWGIVSSCPTPPGEPRGLHGQYLVCDGPTPYVYRVYLKTGSVYSSVPAPGGPGAWGIAGGGEAYELFISNYRTSWIYKVTTTGSVARSFLCPFPGPAGMNSQWPYVLEIAIPEMNLIAIVNRKTGAALSVVPGPGQIPTACSGWAGQYVTDAGTHGLYARGQLVIENLEFPTGVWKGEEPIGDCGPHEYYLVDGATKQIYSIYSDAAVAPASVGRIKALFE
jgi:hypothetical protein